MRERRCRRFNNFVAHQELRRSAPATVFDVLIRPLVCSSDMRTVGNLCYNPVDMKIQRFLADDVNNQHDRTRVVGRRLAV
jgi:hypothetical protein